MKRVIGLVGASLLAFGCGGDDDGGGVGEMVSVDVNAEDGGEVEIGEATLTIPGGALAENTTITAETISADGLPDEGSLTGVAYDFGPDGLEFLTPVTLELPVDGTPGDGQEAVVSWLDGDTWVDVNSTVSGGTVSADIEHFTTFIVRFRDAGPVSCDFSACGGDITGTWNINGLCANQLGDGFEEFCPTAVVDIVIDGSGTVTFNQDNTFEVNLDITGDIDINFPADCTTGAPSCDGLLGSDPGDPVCTGTPSSGCDCSAVIDDTNADSGTYTTSGNDITFDDDTEPGQYCVDGDVLTVQTIEGFIYTGER
jgi:hypothetical protein